MNMSSSPSHPLYVQRCTGSDTDATQSWSTKNNETPHSITNEVDLLKPDIRSMPEPSICPIGPIFKYMVHYEQWIFYKVTEINYRIQEEPCKD